HLGDILQSNTGIFIKSYGQGGLATASFRGTAASHTKVLWNDMPLNSSMNGLIDFSLLPIAFYDGIEIDYGGASLEQNSGSLGGSINLKNGVDFTNRVNIDARQTFASYQ